MSKLVSASIFVSSLMIAGAVASQGMLLDYAADKVIQKFEGSTCAQLKTDKGEPPTDKQKMAVDFLRNDAQARVAFINKIAAPVLNKMFECGMIP